MLHSKIRIAIIAGLLGGALAISTGCQSTNGWSTNGLFPKLNGSRDPVLGSQDRGMPSAGSQMPEEYASIQRTSATEPAQRPRGLGSNFATWTSPKFGGSNDRCTSG